MPRTHFFGPYLHSHASIIFQVIKNFRYRLAYVQSEVPGAFIRARAMRQKIPLVRGGSRELTGWVRWAIKVQVVSGSILSRAISLKLCRDEFAFSNCGPGRYNSTTDGSCSKLRHKTPDFYETIHSGIKIRCNLKFAFNSFFARTLAMPCHLSRSSKFYKFTARGGGLSSISMTLFHHFFAPTRTPCCSSLKS